MINIKKDNSNGYFCLRCLKFFDKHDFIYNHDGIITYRMLVCPICKTDKWKKMGIKDAK